MQTRFIILDDDSCMNTVNMLMLRKSFPGTNVNMVSFTNPAEGVNYLRTDYASHPVPAILLLDINMPALNGWQVLQQLESLPYSALRQLTVYILSASVNPCDIQKAGSHHLVKGFLQKPLFNSLPLLLQTAEHHEIKARTRERKAQFAFSSL